MYNLNSSPTQIWKDQPEQTREPSDEDLRRLVFSGYFLHSARLIQSRKSRLPQYFAVHPSVSGTLDFKSAIVHCRSSKSNNTTPPPDPPQWIVYEKILRLKTTLFPTSTPIQWSWILEESPAFYAFCLEKE
jgi:hypothetical protein